MSTFTTKKTLKKNYIMYMGITLPNCNVKLFFGSEGANQSLTVIQGYILYIYQTKNIFWKIMQNYTCFDISWISWHSGTVWTVNLIESWQLIPFDLSDFATVQCKMLNILCHFFSRRCSMIFVSFRPFNVWPVPTMTSQPNRPSSLFVLSGRKFQPSSPSTYRVGQLKRFRCG